MRIGDIIAGRYQLEEAVGAGGMGEVWRATDLELRRVVALKRATTGDSGETRREARIGAGLHHPNVISVFDVVVEDDRRWLVMEYLQARSLAEICRTDGPVAPSLAASIGAQVAAALSAMHAKGMVHRDITRSNILVTEDGTAKLADLGVAMWDQVTLTGSAKVAGTPGYVAPEVMEGHRASPASDIYSLGVTLSAAVEGHPQADERLKGLLSTMADSDPARRPTAEKAVQLLGGSRRFRFSRRVLVTTAAVVAAAVVASVVIMVTSDSPEGGTAGEATGTSRRAAPGLPPNGGDGKLLYGMGDLATSALSSELVRETPVGMLTTNYHKPSDLPKLESWRDTNVPQAYAEGYALHVVVFNWEEDDPEGPVETKYGIGCGRPYVLSPEFPRHMRSLARVFAGDSSDPPLYVTLFHEVSAMACEDGAWADEPPTTNYYRALKDRYLEVMEIFHEEASNAQVGLGWQVWQAGLDDDPESGRGPSMFEHFTDVIEKSDFQSILAKQDDGNIEQTRRSVRALSEFGRPIIMASYGASRFSGETISKDLGTLLSDESIAELTDLGMFAWNFNSEGMLLNGGRPTLDFVKDVVRRTGREAR